MQKHGNAYIERSLNSDLSSIEKTYLYRKESPKGNFWVITNEQGVVCGMVGLEYKSQKECELRRMSVNAKMRRMGLATLLMKKLEEFVRQEGYKRVYLTLWVQQIGARKLYEKFGFKQVGEPFKVGVDDSGGDVVCLTYEKFY